MERGFNILSLSLRLIIGPLLYGNRGLEERTREEKGFKHLKGGFKGRQGWSLVRRIIPIY